MSEPDEIRSERNKLIATVIALVVLGIISSVAYSMPEAHREIVGFLTVGGIIRLVILLVMVAMVFSSRVPLTSIIGHYAQISFKTKERPERMKVAKYVDGMAGEISNVIIIAILWPLTAKAIAILLRIDTEGSFNWISVLVTVAFVAILFYRLYLGYQHLKPILDVTGGGQSGVACPKCGASSSPTAKFCPSCGADLAPMRTQQEATPSKLCSKCGALNLPTAKFCSGCGENLQETETAQEAAHWQTCSQCGTQNTPKASFCEGCGQPLSAGSSLPVPDRGTVPSTPKATGVPPTERENTNTQQDGGRPDSTAFYTPGTQIFSSGKKLVGMVAAVFLIISLFLPLTSINLWGLELTMTGFEAGGAIVIAGLLCGLACLGAAFLVRPKYRGLISMWAGIIALIVFLLAWLEPPSPETGMTWGEMMSITRLREGAFFFVVSAIVIAINGFLQYKGRNYEKN